MSKMPMQVFINMDNLIGKDFEIGLANLLEKLQRNSPNIRRAITQRASDAGQSIYLQQLRRSGAQV